MSDSCPKSPSDRARGASATRNSVPARPEVSFIDSGGAPGPGAGNSTHRREPVAPDFAPNPANRTAQWAPRVDLPAPPESRHAALPARRRTRPRRHVRPRVRAHACCHAHHRPRPINHLPLDRGTEVPLPGPPGSARQVMGAILPGGDSPCRRRRSSRARWEWTTRATFRA